MKIMKTNMLLLDNKLIKEDAGNTTTVDAPVPTPVEPKEGMKALSFLGMQNLMANPKLAKELGVMNETPVEKESAESYVAPYSSNMSFKGLQTAGAKTMAAMMLIASAAPALQSCEKDEVNVKMSQEVNIDLTAITDAINRLEQRIADLQKQNAEDNAEQIKLLKQMLATLQNAYSVLNELSAKADNTNEFIKVITAKQDEIINAIVTLQNKTIEEAKADVDRILAALASSQMDIQKAMAELQALLKINNELLGDIKAILQDLKDNGDKANAQTDSLLTIANIIIANQNDIKANQKEANAQRDALVARADSLIKVDNNILTVVENIKDGSLENIISVLKALNVSVPSGITKEEAQELLKDYMDELKALNERLESIKSSVSGVNVDVAALVKAAKEITEILKGIAADVAAILEAVNKLAPLLQLYGDSILAKEVTNEKILAAIKDNGKKLDTANLTLNEIKDKIKEASPKIDSLYESAKERDAYLKIIAKYQPKIKAAIDSINAKSGNGITKEELEELWKAQDAAAYAKFKAYMDDIHADDLAKADSVIAYQTEGNKIALDIYNLLNKKLANLDKLNPDELKALLQAIYDYLPNLKCNCNCQGNCGNNQTVHEGIIDLIGN